MEAEFLIFVLAGMTAGAVASLSAHLPATLAFNIPALAPLAVYYLSGGTVAYGIMGFIVIFYALLTSQLAHNIGSTIHERIKAEERFRRISHEQEILLNNARIGISFFKDHKVLRANKYFETVFGWPASETEGLSDGVLFPSSAEYQEVVTEAYSLMAEGESYFTERMLRRKDGSLFWGSLVGTAIDPANPVAGSIWLAEDISARKEAQAQVIQASKLATLGEMATSVAHELSQPLNIIRMAAGNLMRRQERGPLYTEYVREKLNRIDKQTERAAAIIDHMRLFGRKAEERPSRMDLCEAVSGALDLMGEQLRLSEIDVTLDLPPGSCDVLGHRVQVEQVVLNLLANARDAIHSRSSADPGGADQADRENWICVHVLENDHGEVVVTVKDSGGGIPREVISRIFEPFFTTKEIGKGTGLGLSVSHGIIRDMGGRIEATNAAPGAVFTITLPIVG